MGRKKKERIEVSEESISFVKSLIKEYPIMKKKCTDMEVKRPAMLKRGGIDSSVFSMDVAPSEKQFIEPYDAGNSNAQLAEYMEQRERVYLLAKRENMSGIFNWCLQGYKRFCTHGLEPAKAVIDATAEYRKESDRVSQFIDAWLEEGEAYEVRSSAAFNVYQSWCADNGYRAGNAKDFNKAIALRFQVIRKRPKDGGGMTTMVMGCRLREDEDALVSRE